MKVLVVGSYFIDSFAYSIAHAFGKDHEVDVFDSYRVWGMEQRSKINVVIQSLLHLTTREPQKFMNNRLLKKVLKIQPDLILDLSIIMPQTIQQIKQETDAKIISWWPDHLANFGRQYLLASDYDLIFFKDPYIVEKMRKMLGRDNIYYLPQCCDPNLHKSVELSQKEQEYYGCDLTIACNMYYYRVGILDQFLDYEFKIWGNFASWLDTPLRSKWMRKQVTGIEKSKAFNAAKIVLNTNHYAEILGVNKRTFEIAGCGGFQIVDNLPGIEDVFEKGKELVVFDDKKDLKDKVDYYLAHPDERKEIAHRGQERAYKEHTYEKRIAQILDLLSIEGESNGKKVPIRRGEEVL